MKNFYSFVRAFPGSLFHPGLTETKYLGGFSQEGPKKYRETRKNELQSLYTNINQLFKSV